MSDHFDKKCAVCGDRATGINFKVLTCGSCKAFFRRNALKVKQLKCPSDEKCLINVVTRKCCPKCRINKCFDVGMKKELMLSEEVKQKRKNKILEKRKLKDYSNPDQSSTVDSSIITSKSCDSSDIDLTIDDQFIDDILNDNSFNEEDIEQQVKELEDSITDETDDVKEDEISPEVYRKCLELDLVVMPVIRPLTDYQNNFNEVECNRLTELFSALNIMKCPFGEVTAKVDDFSYTLDVIKGDYEAINDKLVQSSKQLTFSKELCDEDQISLVKYGSVTVWFLRHVDGYDCQTNSIIVPHNRAAHNELIMLNLDTIKERKPDLYKASKKYYQRIGKEWDSDPIILDLMTAIVFFNPDTTNLSHREAIRYQQYVYMYLLKRYLQLRYRSECVVTTKFLRLMNTIKYLNNLSQINAKHKMG